MLIRGIRAGDGECGFSCGVPELDQYLARRAWANEKLGVSRTYVLIDAATSTEVLGFYTLSAKSVEPEIVAGLYTRELPRYPVPVFYIGMFGVAAGRQRRGFGAGLMRDALERCLLASADVGALGVYLDSLNARSTAFYSMLGFSVVGPARAPQPMFLPMTTLRKAVT